MGKCSKMLREGTTIYVYVKQAEIALILIQFIILIIYFINL